MVTAAKARALKTEHKDFFIKGTSPAFAIFLSKEWAPFSIGKDASEIVSRKKSETYSRAKQT
jgi:hypothetical protein